MCGTEIAWFTSYLSDRKQCVRCDGNFSKWSQVNGGIPQGSALGPLLFLTYVNEMPSQVCYGKLLQYADDIALICSSTDFAEVHQCLTEDLQSLSAWITQSKMKLNIAKSSVMWFGPKVFATKQIPAVHVGDTPLKPVSTQKYLGIVFDDWLRWHFLPCMYPLFVKRFIIIYIGLMPTTNTCPMMFLKLLIDSLVLSYLTYALPVWGPAISKQCLTHLQHQHNWGVRIVKNLRKFNDVSAHQTQLGWLPVDTLVLCVSCVSFIIRHSIY